MISLLKAIKYENKFSYVYSTQNGFNQIVAKYADFHEYLEDLFNLAPPGPEAEPRDKTGVLTDIDLETVSPESIRQAHEVVDYFYLWKTGEFKRLSGDNRKSGKAFAG